MRSSDADKDAEYLRPNTQDLTPKTGPLRPDTRFRVNIPLHLARPLQEAPQVSPFAPGKFPELQETDLRHLDAGVGLDAPKQVGAAPRGQVMTPRGIPEKTNDIAHGVLVV